MFGARTNFGIDKLEEAESEEGKGEVTRKGQTRKGLQKNVSTNASQGKRWTELFGAYNGFIQTVREEIIAEVPGENEKEF